MNFFLDLPIGIEKFLKEVKAELLVPLRKKQVYNIKKVITDTRKYDGKGGVFFALKGKNFDGHKFVKDIIEDIDYVVISDRNFIIEKYKKKFILVKDTTLALDILGSMYRHSFPNLKVISVVGSNGKTTTKELIKDIFSKKYKTLATEKNFNNLLGVAYTLLSLKRNIDYCILELGISLPGEMDVLGMMSSPDVVVFTNIGKEHLEFLDSLENVFYEETKILDYLNPKGMVVVNRDDKLLKQINRVSNKKLYSMFDKNADVYAEEIKFSEECSKVTLVIKDRLDAKLRFSLRTNLLGSYNVYNILAAITCSFFNGVEELDLIIKAVEEFRPVSMRGERFVINNNIIVDESYNANPDSMACTISEFLKIFKNRRKILVLGDILELGKNSELEHRNLSKIINFDEIEKIFLIGNNMKFLYDEIRKLKKKVKFYSEDKDELIDDLKSLISNENNLAVLFKSSHSVGLFEVIEKIKDFFNRRKV